MAYSQVLHAEGLVDFAEQLVVCDGYHLLETRAVLEKVAVIDAKYARKRGVI